MAPIIVSIEGNIGAGKSTILAQLKTRFSDSGIVAAFMPEPVDVWSTITDETGATILSKFYADPKTYAFPFQIMAYSTRLAMLRKTVSENPECDVIVCERSLEADRNIFAKMLFEDGMIEHVNYQVYQRLYEDTSADFKVDGVVYLDTSPEKCIERIHKRARGGESAIGLEYLSRCKEYYDAWMEEAEDVDILHIDSNPDTEYAEDDVVGMTWIHQVHDYVLQKVWDKTRKQCYI